ncbi:hypothetical protein NEOLI_003736 [Neolecta irregularis DAH-3]|uniref:Ell binding protein Ebp1 C-terminal domain-containing protein n=1 Tax=Neolecta irregularis (strain DAH-3) TaxID=1198029 RepID=A0A1U7LP52_NEOID|nr:hypothetical protein NEOLI_003736 [Neolecta irregularis DAH-3]|eukprot:OLL24450.1 hypothetical protein NEOLI_003736 [Neolecta irregularis DAH-3]
MATTESIASLEDRLLNLRNRLGHSPDSGGRPGQYESFIPIDHDQTHWADIKTDEPIAKNTDAKPNNSSPEIARKRPTVQIDDQDAKRRRIAEMVPPLLSPKLPPEFDLENIRSRIPKMLDGELPDIYDSRSNTATPKKAKRKSLVVKLKCSHIAQVLIPQGSVSSRPAKSTTARANGVAKSSQKASLTKPKINRTDAVKTSTLDRPPLKRDDAPPSLKTPRLTKNNTTPPSSQQVSSVSTPQGATMSPVLSKKGNVPLKDYKKQRRMSLDAQTPKDRPQPQTKSTNHKFESSSQPNPLLVRESDEHALLMSESKKYSERSVNLKHQCEAQRLSNPDLAGLLGLEALLYWLYAFDCDDRIRKLSGLSLSATPWRSLIEYSKFVISLNSDQALLALCHQINQIVYTRLHYIGSRLLHRNQNLCTEPIKSTESEVPATPGRHVEQTRTLKDFWVICEQTLRDHDHIKTSSQLGARFSIDVIRKRFPKTWARRTVEMLEDTPKNAESFALTEDSSVFILPVKIHSSARETACFVHSVLGEYSLQKGLQYRPARLE